MPRAWLCLLDALSWSKEMVPHIEMVLSKGGPQCGPNRNDAGRCCLPSSSKRGMSTHILESVRICRGETLAGPMGMGRPKNARTRSHRGGLGPRLVFRAPMLPMECHVASLSGRARPGGFATAAISSSVKVGARRKEGPNPRPGVPHGTRAMFRPDAAVGRKVCSHYDICAGLPGFLSLRGELEQPSQATQPGNWGSPGRPGKHGNLRVTLVLVL